MIRSRLPSKRHRGILPSGTLQPRAGLLENTRARPSPIRSPGAPSRSKPAFSSGSLSDGVRSRGAYNNNGIMLTRVGSASTTQYTWDFENRLTSVQFPGRHGTKPSLTGARTSQIGISRVTRDVVRLDTLAIVPG